MFARFMTCIHAVFAQTKNHLYVMYGIRTPDDPRRIFGSGPDAAGAVISRGRILRQYTASQPKQKRSGRDRGGPSSSSSSSVPPGLFYVCFYTCTFFFFRPPRPRNAIYRMCPLDFSETTARRPEENARAVVRFLLLRSAAGE